MNPIDHLFPKARIALLSRLLAEPARSFYLRELTRKTGLAVRTVQSELENLLEAGLILETWEGNQRHFKANTGNPVFPDLKGLFQKTTGLIAQLKAALEGLDGIEFAFVFGSFATGNPQPESDIDLCVLGNTGLRKLAPRLRPLADTLAREINPHVLTPQAFLEKEKAGDAFVKNLVTGARLWIIGNEDEFKAMGQ